MIDLHIDKVNGAIFLGGVEVDISSEDVFVKSAFYETFFKQGEINELMPHHYLLKSVIFKDKIFEMIVRPICYDFPFMIQLIDHDSDYFNSREDWNLKADINMLSQSVRKTSLWLSEVLDLQEPDVQNESFNRWLFSWGRVSVSYENKSFDFGIFITWY